MNHTVVLAKKPRHIYIHEELKMAQVSIIFHIGSVYENRIEENGTIAAADRGYSHLLEHLSCELYNDMNDMLSRNGISSNAFTSDESMEFTFTGLDSHLTPELKEKLFKRITGEYTVSDERFKNELSTVIEEYNDVFNDPVSAVLHTSLRKHYNTASAIGLKTDLENAKNEKLKELHDKYIKIPFSVIEIGPTKTDFFDSIEYSDHSESIPVVYGDYNIPFENKENDKVSVTGMSVLPFNGNDGKYIEFISSMLSDGLNSPLYKEIREKRGLSYFQYMFCNTYDKNGYIYTLASTSKERGNELLDVYLNTF